MPYDNANTYDTLIFELSSPGRSAYSLPEPDVDVDAARGQVPGRYLRQEPPALPEVSELDVVRHYSRLSQLNYGLDTHFYPLGSCTMKYNPKLNEDMARLPGFARLHPLAPEPLTQGALGLMHELAAMLAEIAGMDTVSLQPAAGAQGELAGVLMIRAWHEANGEHRTKVLVPTRRTARTRPRRPSPGTRWSRSSRTPTAKSTCWTSSASWAATWRRS